MSQPESDLESKLAGALRRAVHAHWRWYLAEGILLIVLGLGAILVPLLAGLAATILFGWLLLLAGVVGLLFTFRARGVPGFGWSLLSAVAALLAGGVLLWNPLSGLVTLTYVLVAFFVIDGVFMIMFALDHRRELSRRWEWVLINGVVDLVLAVIVVSGMPGTLAWALGLIVGIDLAFGGVSLVAMALEARKDAA